MLLFPLALVLGGAVGWLSGGRLGRLSSGFVRMPWIAIVALIVQVGAWLISSLPSWLRFAMLTASYVAIGVWLAMNLMKRSGPLKAGLLFVTVGWVLNAIVVIVNRGMPVSGWALHEIGGTRAGLNDGGPLGKHLLLTSQSTLSFLGDVIPVPPLRTILSGGDLALALGITVVIASAMHASERTS